MAAVPTVNVFVGDSRCPPVPAGVLASKVCKYVKENYGPGFLVGPNGMGIFDEDSPLPAGNYTYSCVRPAEVVPQGMTAERESPSKRAKVADDTEIYFERLLQPPEKLPDSDADLWKFLSLVPVKLPILSEITYCKVQDKGLVTLECSEETIDLATSVEYVIRTLVRRSGENFTEADSSSDLLLATGNFLMDLDTLAPRARKLRHLECRLDSSNLTRSKGSSKPLLPLRRPDFQLYVSNCLVLRWENKLDRGHLGDAIQENISKLEKWTPLYYGELPYVIGGACAGRTFTWLRLYSTGETLDYGVISPEYDLTKACDVVALLQSTVRMHCLLQKMQEKLDGRTSLRLYGTKQRRDDNTVTFYPDMVIKKVELSDERVNQLQSLYEAVDGSLYVIQLKGMRQTKGTTRLLLHPVGYPEATPRHLKEVEDATHDILHGLSDLHRADFTHRDVRWENIVKVPIKGKWKYVIIDLEEGGPDKEVWKGEKLLNWDTNTLDSSEQYTTKSDLYQFGKLLIQWLSTCQDGSKEERDKVMSLGNQMEKKRTPASKMVTRICKKGCERCRTFGKAGNQPPPLP